VIERLRPGDGPRLRAIRLRALADAPDAFATTLADAEKRDPGEWEAQIAALPTFVWREGDADVGLVRGAAREGDPESGYLVSMWVAPEARGRGVGAVLVEGVVAWARGSGLRRLYLDVGLHNAAARRLYERMGFVATGAMPQTPACVHEMEMAMALRDVDAGPGGVAP